MQENEQAIDDWRAALEVTLADAIEHLQVLIFNQNWDAILQSAGSKEDALRDSVVLYERELGRIFAFVRQMGVLVDGVAWSTFKADLRRAALDAGTEISLRTALESGLYAAEPVTLGNHAAYQRWSAELRSFLRSRAAGIEPPIADAPAEERLEWAYHRLADLEDHEAFHAAVIDWLEARAVGADVIDHQRFLLTLPRFDLVLNTSLRWLAEATR